MKRMTESLKEFALRAGADMVGIGDIGRFEGTSPEQDPRHVFPEARSIVGLGFRMLRGSLRGVEEGTTYFHYPGLSVLHLEEVKIPTTLLRVSAFIEDCGYDSVPQRFVPDVVRNHTNPEKDFRGIYQMPASSGSPTGKPDPDVMMDFNQAAAICGLGEIGLSSRVLTHEYGPFQRFGFILTDAELDPDPVLHRSICDECGACVDGCYGRAYDSTRHTVTFGGVQYSVAGWNQWQCAVYYAGAFKAKNPFMPGDALSGLDDGNQILRAEKHLTRADAERILPHLHYYGPTRHGYAGCICGRSCDRACYIHLEGKGALSKKFHEPFRKREDWFIG